MVMEGDLTWGGEHTIQCTEDMLQNCTPECYVILLTGVTPINSIKKTNSKIFVKDYQVSIRIDSNGYIGDSSV